MSTETTDFLNATVDVPEIVITEPSPLIKKTLATSIPVHEKEVPSREEHSGEVRTSVETGDALPVQKASLPEQERDSSSEFSPAEDCVECVVPVPEVQVLSEQAEPATESSLTDPDEFRTYGCCNLNTGYEGPYEYIWNILESRYAIPFWLLGMVLPLSAGVMGAIHMFSCSAANSLPNMVFMIGISLMAVLTLRICIIIHRMTWEDENARSMLQTINLICFFITFLFFITESATFWQMISSNHPGARDYCHPTFSTYAFWWNIATSVFMIILLLFPIA